MKCFKEGTLDIEGKTYISDWAIGDAPYDVILGMLWHTDIKHFTGYDSSLVSFTDGSSWRAQGGKRTDWIKSTGFIHGD